MFTKFQDWRREHKVDTICSEQFPNVPKIFQYYPHGYYGTTKEGHPIYIERHGTLDLKKIFQLVTEEELVRYFIAGYERCIHIVLPEASRAAGRYVGRTFTILDAKGMSTT